MTHPEILMATYQTAQLANQPMLSYKKSVMRIGCCLLNTHKQGIIYTSDTTKGLECYIDANLPGGWSQADVENAEIVLS
jgi:hypothetical protein